MNVVIAGRSNRTMPIDCDELRYRAVAHRGSLLQLNDFRQMASRYDKLARSFHLAVALVTLVAFWV